MHQATPSPTDLPHGHAKRFVLLALLVLGVIAIHLWILGGTPRWLTHGETSSDAGPQVITLNTRTWPTPQAPSAVASPAPASKPVRARRRAVAEPPPTSPATATHENFESNTPPAPAEPAQAAIEDIAKPADAEPAPASKAYRYRFPTPAQLHYDVDALTDGNHNVATAELTWQHDGSNYQTSLIARKFTFFKLRQWNSTGQLGTDGLAPLRFADKTRSEVAAHFVREQSKVVFSANTPPVDLLPGAQDKLSVFLQLASMLNGDPDAMAPGERITFQTIGDRYAESWTFVMDAKESLELPSATLDAYKFTRESEGQYDIKAEAWLAPAMTYLPVRIRLTQTNGNVLDMVWTESRQP